MDDGNFPLNGVDPQAWLTDTIGHIPDHKLTRLDEFTPWRYAHMVERNQTRSVSAGAEQRTVTWDWSQL